MTDPLSALRDALTHGRAVAHGDGFGVWLDPTAIRLLLEHVAQQDARIASLRLELADAVTARDRARNLAAGLIEQPPPNGQETA